jgi:hypothetical protein
MTSGGQRDPTAEVVSGASETNLDSVEVDNLRKITRLEARNRDGSLSVSAEEQL